ncbi:MAG: outer membrane beta-barrel protein [Cyclobacteriaceae bacterium]|nr:outer membrane beta-barrel protein [Cyclobacteriaceae bacterium]
MMKLILPLVVFVCLCVNSTAQDFRLTPGSYETNTGEKVSGFFLSKGTNKNSNAYIFLKEKESEKIILKPEDVKSISLDNGEYLISVKDSLKQANFFATRLSYGTLNLYEFFDGDQTSFYLDNTNYSAIIKGTNIQTKKASNAYKGTLNYFIKGCKQAENKIDRMYFRAYEVMQLVTLFNKCKDDNYVEHKSKKNWFLELNAGTVVNRHYFKAQSFYINERQEPRIGLAVGLKYSLFVHPKIAIYTGLNYRNYRSAIENYQSKTSSLVFNADFSIKTLSLPIGFSYFILNKENLKLAINLDYQFGRLIEEGFTETSNIFTDPVKKKNELENICTVFSSGLNFSFKKYVVNLNYHSGSFIVGNQQALNTSGVEILMGYRLIDTRK